MSVLTAQAENGTGLAVVSQPESLHPSPNHDKMLCIGEMAERFKAPVLKTGMGQLIVGSNPSLSAS